MQSTTVVHQIFINNEMTVPSRFGGRLEENIRSVPPVYPGAEHRVWSGNDLRAFIAEQFGKTVVDAFDTLSVYAYKSDLGRLCLLHHFGGFYIDLGLRAVAPILPPDDVGIVGFRAPDFATPSWTTMSNGLIWSRPGRNELVRAIEMIVDNCAQRRYGAGPLHPTGPVVLGRALVAEAATKGQGPDADDQWIGVSRPLTPDGPDNPNIGYVTPDYRLVALRAKEVGGDLSHIGLEGGNNYVSLWQQRRCFGERASTFSHTNNLVCLTDAAVRTVHGIAAKPDSRGVLTYGPFIPWKGGSFRFTARFDRPVSFDAFTLDVMIGPGHIVARQTFDAVADAPVASLSMDFELAADVDQIQFRTDVGSEFAGCISEISIEDISPS